MMFIDMMERDQIFATGRAPREVESNYLDKRWKELAHILNTCNSGPTLTANEWKKRLNDWKNTTRCKYRRSNSGEKDISMTTLELKALKLFGKTPQLSAPADPLAIHLKSEKIVKTEIGRNRTSESLLQAAVEEAIGGDDLEVTDEPDDEVLVKPLQRNSLTVIGPIDSGASMESVNSNLNSGTTYQTIVVESGQYTDEENNDVEYITQASQPTTIENVSTPAKLINSDITLKRTRSDTAAQVIYAVKKSPVSIKSTTYSARRDSVTPTTRPLQEPVVAENNTNNTGLQPQTCMGLCTELAQQVKRLADIKAEKLKFEIARFKFNNPGFQFN